jgi:hypothetical protein
MENLKEDRHGEQAQKDFYRSTARGFRTHEQGHSGSRRGRTSAARGKARGLAIWRATRMRRINVRDPLPLQSFPIRFNVQVTYGPNQNTKTNSEARRRHARIAKWYSFKDLAIATGLTVEEISAAEDEGGAVPGHHAERIEHAFTFEGHRGCTGTAGRRPALSAALHVRIYEG